LLAYRMVLFLHGGSPFKVSQPDSTESGWTAAQLSTMGGTSSGRVEDDTIVSQEEI
jgi:hypothetical protein